MHKVNPKIKGFAFAFGNFLSNFIIAAVAIIAVFFIVIKLLGWNMFYIDSASMTPLYPVNTLIVVQTVDPEEIQTGDVITYILNKDNVLVTHRVTSIDYDNQTFTTKGDANNVEDALPVRWDNVVGKVLIRIPMLGKPLRILSSEEYRPILIGVIAVMLAFSLIWDFWERKKKKRQNKVATPTCETQNNNLQE